MFFFPIICVFICVYVTTMPRDIETITIVNSINYIIRDAGSVKYDILVIIRDGSQEMLLL